MSVLKPFFPTSPLLTSHLIFWLTEFSEGCLLEHEWASYRTWELITGFTPEERDTSSPAFFSCPQSLTWGGVSWVPSPCTRKGRQAASSCAGPCCSEFLRTVVCHVQKTLFTTLLPIWSLTFFLSSLCDSSWASEVKMQMCHLGMTWGSLLASLSIMIYIC